MQRPTKSRLIDGVFRSVFNKSGGRSPPICQKSSKNLPARPDKTIDWLNKSRDDWKGKTQATKAELKVAQQAQRRARQSRQEWKEEYQQLERQSATVIAAKDEENANLKTKMQERAHSHFLGSCLMSYAA